MKLRFRALFFLLASLLYCASASAEGLILDNNILYTILSNGEVEITNVYSKTGHFEMPSTITDQNGTVYTITSIGNNAFYGCSELASIVISSGVESIGSNAFSGCSELANIEIPESVTSIGNGAFSGCIALEGIKIPNSVTFIDWNLFNGCTSLANIEIPKRVTSIGNNAFYGCSALASIEIPESVESIGSSAFEGCASLASIVIPSGVKIIKDNAFSVCRALASIEIPESVTTIGVNAFYGCSALANIEIPKSVTSIESGAFDGCASLASIRMQSATPPTIQATSFSYSYNIATLYIPDGSLTAYQNAENWNGFKNIMQYVIHLEIKDGAYTNFNYDNPRYCDAITYTRTLKTDYWNALYLPYEIPVGKILDNGNYEVAYINDVRSYDDNNDGIVDRMAMEIFNITSGTLNANHPYMIKAKSDENNTVQRTMNLVLENTILHTTVSNSLVCSSVYTNFTITGIYEKMTEGTDLEDCLVMSGGKWISMAAGSSLNPFRLYMKIEERGGSPFKVDPAAYARIAIRVIGEDDATGIEDTMHEGGAKAEKAVFDISGRKVKNPAKGGVYISDGKIFIN